MSPGAPIGLLLDFGCVVTYSLFEKHRDTERALGLAAGSLGWLGPLDPDSDDLWRRLERGEIDERDYWARRAEELGRAVGEPGWTMLALMRRIRHDDPNAAVRPGMLALVRRAAAAGIRIGVLSNDLALFYGADFAARVDVLRHVAVFIDGSTSGVLKPDPAAYRAAIDAMGLPARQTLFVDDQLRNVVGALQAGLQVQHFDVRDASGSIAAVAARLRLDPLPGATP